MEEKMNISAEELAEFRAYKEKQAAAEALKAQKETYSKMVDEQLEKSIEVLLDLSNMIEGAKKLVYDNFSAIIEMKRDMLHLTKKDGQYTHTFTDSSSMRRITLGNRTVDAYNDTAEDGIAIVREFLGSLGKDEESRALVDAILDLLSRGKNGQLQPSRVLQLRNLADEIGNERLREGVDIISTAYQPVVSRSFIRAEFKNGEGEWEDIPLSISAV